jgi:hypothetical protein
MNNNFELLKEFVKDTLGCQCPDDVFDSILKKENVILEGDLNIDLIFIIGNRLLIFLFTSETPELTEKLLPKLIRHGKIQRDSNNLNRFRLVILTDDPQTIEAKINSKFSELTEDDKKIHLHVLDKAKLKSLNFI